jgi:hypothetical protein
MKRLFLSAALSIFPAAWSEAGGGLVLEDDVCILWIDFYSAHLTSYQPAVTGNKQFCGELPSTGETIFVLDYLHQSLKDVPVDFRLIHNVTGQGSFVKLKHVEALGNLDQHTVFYAPPAVYPDASLKVEHAFDQEGLYVAVVSAGHPTNDSIYTAVFPVEVGASKVNYLLVIAAVLVVAALLLIRWRSRSSTAAPVREGSS